MELEDYKLELGTFVAVTSGIVYRNNITFALNANLRVFGVLVWSVILLLLLLFVLFFIIFFYLFVIILFIYFAITVFVVVVSIIFVLLLW